jgi:hypothetical protein
MKHLQMGVYQVCSNKSPWDKISPALWAYIQVSDFRAIMALLFEVFYNKVHKLPYKKTWAYELFEK